MVNTDIINAYLGSSQVDKIMLGTEQVYPTAEPVYSEMYLTVEALENGNFYVRNENFEFSKNGGAWTSGVGNQTIPLVTGDKVRFRYNANSSIQSRFSGNTMSFKVYGNIESMEYGDNFSGQTTVKLQNAFNNCFFNSSGLIDASNLILPATALTQSCYSGLFRGTSITVAPALPATQLARECYSVMFSGCTGLTTAPELPATQLTRECYYRMFKDCTGLRTAPALPATTLADYCYTSMFEGCSSLNSIRCLAITMSASNCLSNWVLSVAASGTFTKAAGASWATGNNGIPVGWTVIEEGDKLTFEDSDGQTVDGQQYSPGMWDMTATIDTNATFTLYYGGEVVTADTHVTIRNDWDGTIDYEADETGMVWSNLAMAIGYSDTGLNNLTINYSAETGTAELVVGYWHDNTPPDICADWESGGYSSWEECRCVNYGEYCEPEDPCAGYSSQEECDCVMNGGIWDGVNCEGSCNGDPECECVNQGGTWNGTDCEFPDPCAGDPECECINQGGIWNGTDCEPGPQPEPDE